MQEKMRGRPCDHAIEPQKASTRYLSSPLDPHKVAASSLGVRRHLRHNGSLQAQNSRQWSHPIACRGGKQQMHYEDTPAKVPGNPPCIPRT